MMQPAGLAYCQHCRDFREARVGIGMPQIIALICSTCWMCLATALPDHNVSFEDLPAFARLRMIPNLPYDDGSEAFRIASFETFE